MTHPSSYYSDTLRLLEVRDLQMSCLIYCTHIVIHVPVLIPLAFGCAVADSKFIDLGSIHFYHAVGPVSNLDVLCLDVL